MTISRTVGTMAAVSGLVLGLYGVSAGEAAAKPKKPGGANGSCEKYDTYAVCDTLPSSDGWQRCTFYPNNPSKRDCEHYRSGQAPTSYPPYNIAERKRSQKPDPPPNGGHWGEGEYPSVPSAPSTIPPTAKHWGPGPDGWG